MAKQKLKINKSQKARATQKQLRLLHPQSSTTHASLPILTPAEQAEVARFRALTLKRATHQALVHQTMARLDDLESDVVA
jgi:hypothetical protein